MQQTSNTIRITSGGSGIGCALAAAWHAEGNQVVIAERHSAKLEATTQAHSGMRSLVHNINSAESIRRVAGHIKADFSTLNFVVHNACMMQAKLLASGELDVSHHHNQLAWADPPDRGAAAAPAETASCRHYDVVGTRIRSAGIEPGLLRH